MNTVTIVVAAGALAGWGVWLIWSGWTPVRAPLVDTLARLGQPVAAPGAEAGNVDARVGRWALRLSMVQRMVGSMRTDLRVLRRSPDEQAASIVAMALGGLLWAPMVTAGVWIVGVRVPIAVPLWLAVAGGALGALTAVRSTRQKAAGRRRSFAHALGAFCDVAGLCLASGRGIDASIQTAAAAGDGWAFNELRSALRAGYVRGDTPWRALDTLAAECDLADLAELAAALSLSGGEGAAVRDTIASKARSIRERLTSTAERDAAAVTERMSIPATLLLFGFVGFLVFPALALLFST